MQTKTYSSYSDNNLVYNHLEHSSLIWSSTTPETHDIFEIIYIKKGNVTYVVEGKSYQVGKNSIIFTRPGMMHTIYFNDYSIYDRYDIFFDKSIIFPKIYHKISEVADVINTDGCPAIGELFEKMDYYFGRFEKEEFRNILSHLTEEIVYNILLLSGDSNNSYSANPVIIKAIEYIEKNITQNFTLVTLCNQLYINKSHLHRLFLKHLQITPKKYITSKRLEFAQKLLRRGAKPIDVYLYCGFSEYSTFFRDYKKHFGYSPSQEADKKIKREIRF